MQVSRSQLGLSRSHDYGIDTFRPSLAAISRKPHRRHIAANSASLAAATYPRIIEELPLRRLHSHHHHLPRVVDFSSSTALFQQLFKPDASINPELLTWTSVLFGLILLAIAAEFTQRTLNAVTPLNKPLLFEEGQNSLRRPQQQGSLTARKQREQERLLCKQVMRFEKFRGLQWLAIVTAISVSRLCDCRSSGACSGCCYCYCNFGASLQLPLS